MIRLPTAALVALRDRLADRGARPSISSASSADGGHREDPLDRLLQDQYGPLCDAMYLMMAADGQLTAAERDVIRGALRELDDRIRSRHVESMMVASHAALARDGWEARYRALGEALVEDRPRAEAALLLAAAVAYADDEIAPSENDVMVDLMRVLEVPQARMEELVASLQRIDTVLDRDANADAADVVAHAALRLSAPEDFERLATTTDRPDVSLTLRLYAAYVHALEDLLDAETHPQSIPVAVAGALHELGHGFPEKRSPRLDGLRGSLIDLAEALGRLARAGSLSQALRADSDDGSPLVALDLSLSRVSLLVARALDRLGEPFDKSRVEVDLRDQVARVISGEPHARTALSAEAERALAVAAHTVPAALLRAVRIVVAQLCELPIEASESASAPKQKTLPDWLPSNGMLGSFYVERALGEGAAGSVLVAVKADERTNPSAERFAVKVPHYDAVAARSVSESEYLSVFRREAETLSALPQHPNICGYVTFDSRARPKPILVMQLVEGTDVLALIKQRAIDGKAIADILDGMLAGLGAMHDVGIAHLDVKPANVVRRAAGDAVLVDFGLAGRQLRVGCATPMYAAPEVWGHVDEGCEPAPTAADVYAFGCVVYELLTGNMLFSAPHALAILSMHMEHDGEPKPVSELIARPAVAPLARLISQCLRKRASERPTVAALREQLGPLRPSIESLSWPVQ